MEPKFPLGRTLITPNARAHLNPEDVLAAFARHASGDWGEVCQEDKLINEESLQRGSWLLSAYTDRSGTRFWIITEADRSATTVMLPEDY